MKVWKEFYKSKHKTYYVNNYGEIKTISKNGNERILKPQMVEGYNAVYVNINGKQKWLYIHRIMASVFLPNIMNLPQVNHKDENKTNNYICINDDGSVNEEKSNLEWCTQKYNINYGTVKERIKDTNIKNGKWTDDRGMTIGEKEEFRKQKSKEYYQKKRTSNLDHHFYVYKHIPIITHTYELVGEYDRETDAATDINVSTATINYAKKNGKWIKKRYIITREPIV